MNLLTIVCKSAISKWRKSHLEVAIGGVAVGAAWLGFIPVDNPVGYALVVFLATAAAKATDPLIMVSMALALGVGLLRRSAWLPLLITVFVTAITVAALYSWWAEMGVAVRQLARMPTVFLASLMLIYTAYGIGLLMRVLFGAKKGASQEKIELRAQHIENLIKNEADVALKELKQRWIFFCQSLHFKEDVPLESQISMFLPLGLNYLNKNYRYLSKAPPHVTALLFLTAVMDSKTHDREEVNRAGKSIWPFLFENNQ